MNKEGIKRILTKLISRNNVNIQEVAHLLEQYILATKNIQVKINMYGAYDINEINYALTFAADYFKAKFGVITLFNKKNELIDIKYTN